MTADTIMWIWLAGVAVTGGAAYFIATAGRVKRSLAKGAADDVVEHLASKLAETILASGDVLTAVHRAADNGKVVVKPAHHTRVIRRGKRKIDLSARQGDTGQFLAVSADPEPPAQDDTGRTPSRRRPNLDP